MAITFEGTIEIDLAEFWKWVVENHTHNSHFEYAFGVPRVNKENKTLMFDFAAGYDSSPHEWVEKPACLKQWKEAE